jgi:hypothetical protein
VNAEVPRWQKLLWEELDAQSPQQQFVTTAEWINGITRHLLPELATRRRENVLTLVDQDEGSVAAVAGQLGMRRTTISRLVDEGRSARKQAKLLLQHQEQAA